MIYETDKTSLGGVKGCYKQICSIRTAGLLLI